MRTGIIYKLICETGAIYIGSTENTLEQRLKAHIKKGNVCKSKDFINPTISELEKVEFDDYQILLTRERHYIETIKCVNIKIPTRTRKEWYLDNKEAYCKKKQEYRKNNKDLVNKWTSDYRKTKEKILCECGGKYDYQNKARHIKTKKHQNNI